METELNDREKTELMMLQNEFNSFDFSPLMRDIEKPTSWTAYVPVVTAILQLVTIIIVFATK